MDWTFKIHGVCKRLSNKIIVATNQQVILLLIKSKSTSLFILATVMNVNDLDKEEYNLSSRQMKLAN